MLVKYFQPEIFLCLSLLIQLLYNTNLTRNYKLELPILNLESTFQLYTIFFWVTLLIYNSNYFICEHNMWCFDENTQKFKLLIVLICVLIVPLVKEALTIQKLNFVEFDVVFLLSILAGLLLINSYDFLVVYLLIEMQSLCFYILTAFKRDSTYSSEAGLKYFIFGSIISCFFLLGLSFFYGITGTLSFHDLTLLNLFEYEKEFELLILFSIYFISIFFLFKFILVPFHFWALDVYEGAPLASTIVFSLLAKPILIHLIMKWIFILGIFFFYVKKLFIYVGLFSIVLGSISALKQKRFKRLIIYSSISQVGFLILALSLNTFNGNVYAYFFLIIYLLTSVLIWGYICFFYSFKSKIFNFFKISLGPIYLFDFENLFKNNKLFSLDFIVIFCSIGGIPPLVGFTSKMLILSSFVQKAFIFLSFFIILISSVSIYYYIRIIKIIFFHSQKKKIYLKNFQTIFKFSMLSFCSFSLTVCQSLLIFLFLYSDILLYSCEYLVLTATCF